MDEESVSDLEFEEPSSTKDAEYDQVRIVFLSNDVQVMIAFRLVPSLRALA